MAEDKIAELVTETLAAVGLKVCLCVNFCLLDHGYLSIFKYLV